MYVYAAIYYVNCSVLQENVCTGTELYSTLIYIYILYHSMLTSLRAGER